MLNQKMYEYGSSPSKIRELFEYGKKEKPKLVKKMFLILV